MTAALIVGSLASDASLRPIPGSEERPCATCGRGTMFSPVTLSMPEALDPGSTFSCLECAKLEGLEIARPSDGQARELRAAGYDAVFWANAMWGERPTRGK